jgi:hypothetical protein
MRYTGPSIGAWELINKLLERGLSVELKKLSQRKKVKNSKLCNY